MGVVVKTVKVPLSPMEQIFLRKHVKRVSELIGVPFTEEDAMVSWIKFSLFSESLIDSEEAEDV